MFFTLTDTDNQLKKAALSIRVIGYILTVIIALASSIPLFYHAFEYPDLIMLIFPALIAFALVFAIGGFFTELASLKLYAKGELLEAAYDIVDYTRSIKENTKK